MRRAQSISFVVLFLAFVAWVGNSFWRNYRERVLVERLPRAVAIRGPFSAREGLGEAKRVAAVWDPDCRLQVLYLGFRGDPHADDPGLEPTGIPRLPSGWTYRFFSASRGWFLDLTLTPDGGCEADSFNGIDYLDSQPLPEEFLDSTEALAIAERLYGAEYATEGKLFRRLAHLTTWRSVQPGPRDPVPHRATWQIEFLTTRGRNRVDVQVILDARTGKELCTVETMNTTPRVLVEEY